MITIDGNDIVKGYFPNGEVELYSDLLIEWLECAFEPAVKVIYEDDKDMFHLLLLSEFLTEKDVIKDTILEIDFMPYSQMDRAIPGKMFTLKYVCNLLNRYAWSKIEVSDPHSNVTPALLNKCNIIESCAAGAIHESMTTPIKAHQYDYVLFPDAGASKKYIEEVDNIFNTAGIEPSSWPAVITGNKKRNLDTGEIVSYKLDCDDDLTGKKVMICDDLVMGGRTFTEAAKLLRENGAAQVDLYVTHLMPQAEQFFKTKGNGLIDNIYSNDTLHMGAKWNENIYRNAAEAKMAGELIPEYVEKEWYKDPARSSIIECKGDMFAIDNALFKDVPATIVYGDPVNMYGVDGVHGLAKIFKDNWPVVWKEYKSWVGTASLLARISEVKDGSLGIMTVLDEDLEPEESLWSMKNGDTSYCMEGHGVMFINTMPWEGIAETSMEAVIKSLEAIANTDVVNDDTFINVWDNKERVLVLPALGCGIGGLNYEEVRPHMIKCANKLIDNEVFDKVIIMTPEYTKGEFEVVNIICK